MSRRRGLITKRELDLTHEELHLYNRIRNRLAPDEHLLEELTDLLLHRAPAGLRLVPEPQLRGKGVPAARPWA